MGSGVWRTERGVFAAGPYREGWSVVARGLDGRWDPVNRWWEFHPQLEGQVRAAFDRIYGTVGGDDPSGDSFASWFPTWSGMDEADDPAHDHN